MKKISVLVLLLMGTIALAADYTKDNVCDWEERFNEYPYKA